MDDEQLWEWVSVKDEHVCPDCRERDGQVKTVEEWEALGIPKSGATRCGQDCTCMILPAGWTDETLELRNPVILTEEQKKLFSPKALEILEEDQRRSARDDEKQTG
jgi:hypothetical protein